MLGAASLYWIARLHMATQQAEELRVLLEENARLERDLIVRVDRLHAWADSVLARREFEKKWQRR